MADCYGKPSSSPESCKNFCSVAAIVSVQTQPLITNTTQRNQDVSLNYKSRSGYKIYSNGIFMQQTNFCPRTRKIGFQKLLAGFAELRVQMPLNLSQTRILCLSLGNTVQLASLPIFANTQWHKAKHWLMNYSSCFSLNSNAIYTANDCTVKLAFGIGFLCKHRCFHATASICGFSKSCHGISARNL